MSSRLFLFLRMNEQFIVEAPQEKEMLIKTAENMMETTRKNCSLIKY